MQLSRVVTRGRKFLPEIDGLRFVAIMFVVVCHLSGYTVGAFMAGAELRPAEAWLPGWLSNGRYGVELFFVLSGFLLSMPFAEWRLGLTGRPSLKRYYLRRVTRLEPPYIVAMVTVFSLGFLIHRWGSSTVWPDLTNWRELLARLVYQHNLLYSLRAGDISNVAWSLEIEVQFYLIAPFLAAVFSISSAKARRSLLLAVIVGLPLFRDLLPGQIGTTYNSLPWHLEWFLTGFLFADFYIADWRERPHTSYAWDLISLAGWAGSIALFTNGHFLFVCPLTILAACLGAFRGQVSSWLLSRRPIILIGGMCYSIYLVHYGTISVVDRVTQKFAFGPDFASRFALNAVFTIPTVLAVAIAFYALIERPCMDPTWLSKVIGKVHCYMYPEAHPLPTRQ